MEKITAEEAFKAMILLLEDYYEQSGLEYLGGVLGELIVTSDGRTMDTAAGIKWLESLERATKSNSLLKEKIKSLTIDEAFNAMCLLLEQFSKEIKTEDFNIILNDLRKYNTEKSGTEIRKKWNRAIDIAKMNNYPLDVSKFRS